MATDAVGGHCARTGPRGLESILFGLLLLKGGVEGRRRPFAIVAWTVDLSVLLHGATAARGCSRLRGMGGLYDRHREEGMPEGLDFGDVDI